MRYRIRLCAFVIMLLGVYEVEAENEGAKEIVLRPSVPIVGQSGFEYGVPFRCRLIAHRENGFEVSVMEMNGIKQQKPLKFPEKDIVFFTPQLAKLKGRESGFDVECWVYEIGRSEEISSLEPLRMATPQKGVRSTLFVCGFVELGDERVYSNTAATNTIRAVEIGSDTIKGGCGHRFGEWMVVTGMWQKLKRTKGYEYRFVVNSVDGVPANGSDVEFTEADVLPVGKQVDVAPVDGQSWRIEAYETVEWDGIADGFFTVTGSISIPTARRGGMYNALRWRKLTVLELERRRE